MERSIKPETLKNELTGKFILDVRRAADCGQPQLAQEAAGLLAISKGLSLNFADDLEMLKHGLVIYDALYAWCAELP